MLALAAPAIALLIPLVVVVTVVLTARPAGGHDDPGEHDGRGGDDGGGPRHPPRFPRPPGRAEPDWWPEFERAFAAHVQDRAVTT